MINVVNINASANQETKQAEKPKKGPELHLRVWWCEEEKKPKARFDEFPEYETTDTANLGVVAYVLNASAFIVDTKHPETKCFFKEGGTSRYGGQGYQSDLKMFTPTALSNPETYPEKEYQLLLAFKRVFANWYTSMHAIKRDTYQKRAEWHNFKMPNALAVVPPERVVNSELPLAYAYTADGEPLTKAQSSR